MPHITKEAILAKVTPKEILDFYLRPYHNDSELREGKNISNPFQAQKQQTPSFNIYRTRQDAEWRFKDFATGEDGSCFDLVMKLKNLSFSETLRTINQDMGLFLDNQPIHSLGSPQNYTGQDLGVIGYSIIRRPFTTAELNYWNKYGISSEILSKYNVSALAEFSAMSRSGKPYTIRSHENSFLFAYENKDWLKVYKPLDQKQYRFQYLGTKDKDFIFGMQQLPENGDMVFITGGEKDVMTLSSKGFCAISLNSETSAMQEGLVLELKSRFNKIIVLYDNDQTGLEQSNILAQKHGFHRVVLPEIPNHGKDISDYFASNGSLEDFREMWNVREDGQQKQQDGVDIFEKYDFVKTAVQLMAMDFKEDEQLLAPLLPRSGCAVLAGKPDSGKSLFALQLCVHIVSGIKRFVGLELKPKYQSVIVVLTEDNMREAKTRITKQLEGLGISANTRLRFIFAQGKDHSTVLETIHEFMKLQPADLILIDSFGDIFTGNDTNSNVMMRETIKPYDAIAAEYDCLVLFIHHINKASYQISPRQENVQGGAGLVQKVRLALQMSEDETSDDIRYLSVTKGNYCSKDLKKNSMVLKLDENYLIFEETGRTIPTKEIGTASKDNKSSESALELQKIAIEFFEAKPLTYGQFVQSYCTRTGKAIATAKRKIKEMKAAQLILEVNGMFRLNLPSTNHETSPECIEAPF